MEIVFIIALAFILIVAFGHKTNSEEAEKKKREQTLRDLLEKEKAREEAKLEQMKAERVALVEEKDETKEVDTPISDDDMLITQNCFNEMCQLLKDVCDSILDICREGEFQKYVLGIKEGYDDVDNSQKMFSSLKFFIIKDVLRSYERLGHKYYTYGGDGKMKCNIKYDTAEGQLLFVIVSQMMKLDDNRQISWEQCKNNVLGQDLYSSQIRTTTTKALNTYANADVRATASNGLDDFAFCIVLHNYNKVYETTYRKKMLRIATVIANADGKVSSVENEWLDSIMNPYGKDDVSEEEKIIEHPDEELNSLIGLSKVKNEINTLCNFVIMRKKREAEGLKSPTMSYHCVFTGNPGTGKTTVARILGGIYRDMGVLKKGHLVETDRSGLVAEYVGQTAVKTNKIIDSALDGVLFIDEAYTLANGGTNDYGPEAIATLLKRMEDDRNRLVVILAGYNKEIETFINSNPGLRSRFNRYIHFEDYTAEELHEIFCLQVRKSEYTLTNDASLYLKERLTAVLSNKPKGFGNARYVRNLFEKAVEAQANRLASKAELSKQDLTEITKEDLFLEDVSPTEKSGTIPVSHEAYLRAKEQTIQVQAKGEPVQDEEITRVDKQTETHDLKKKESIEELLAKASSYSNGFDDYDEETIEVSYTVSGYYDVDETSIDVSIKEREYNWLTRKDEDGEYLDSEYISENRRGLHKHILRAIRENLEEEGIIDSPYAVDNDDIEYTINL